MKTRSLLQFASILVFPGALACTAAEGGPRYCQVLDAMSLAARAESTRAIALRVLKQMARGDGSVIEPSAEKELALPPDYAPKSAISSPETRSCAIRSLGKTGLPEAVEFLKTMTPADSGADPAHVIWHAVQIALREAALTGIRSPQDRAVFLEGVLKEHHDNASNIAVNNWAIVKICDEGLTDAWPTARSKLKQMWEGDTRGEDEIRHLEARIQIAARDPNRARALGSVFDSFVQMESTGEGHMRLQWAVETLDAMHTADADAELDRIYAQLQDSLKQFPNDPTARDFVTRIEDSRTWRALYKR